MNRPYDKRTRKEGQKKGENQASFTTEGRKGRGGKRLPS